MRKVGDLIWVEESDGHNIQHIFMSGWACKNCGLSMLGASPSSDVIPTIFYWPEKAYFCEEYKIKKLIK